MGGSYHSSGLGPVWDDFLEEVSLGLGLGLQRSWRRLSSGAVALWVFGLEVEKTKEVQWVIL